jgi:hypothetical protein
MQAYPSKWNAELSIKVKNKGVTIMIFTDHRVPKTLVRVNYH